MQKIPRPHEKDSALIVSDTGCHSTVRFHDRSLCISQARVMMFPTTASSLPSKITSHRLPCCSSEKSRLADLKSTACTCGRRSRSAPSPWCIPSGQCQAMSAEPKTKSQTQNKNYYMYQLSMVNGVISIFKNIYIWSCNNMLRQSIPPIYNSVCKKVLPYV